MADKKVGDLKPSRYNPRKISQAQLDRLGKSMADFGDLSGIVMNRRTGNLVGGHQRLKHLDPDWKIESKPHTDDTGTVAIGHIDTPWGRWSYREVDWPEKKELAGNLAANKQGGEFDVVKLKLILTELDSGDFDMDLTGFGGEEIKDLFDNDPGALGDDEKCEACGQRLPSRRIG